MEHDLKIKRGKERYSSRNNERMFISEEDMPGLKVGQVIKYKGKSFKVVEKDDKGAYIEVS